jgi:hypothetical protein
VGSFKGSSAKTPHGERGEVEYLAFTIKFVRESKIEEEARLEEVKWK